MRRYPDIYIDPWPKPQLAECIWYHTFDLPEAGLVFGQWDLRGRFKDYTSHVPLAGLRVLDVGTASGFLTWEAELAGAQVVSFDLDDARRQKLLPFREQIYMTDRAQSERERNGYFDGIKRSYWYMHHTIKSQAQAYYGDIENLPPDLGQFDVAILGSVLEHLADQIQVLASVARLANLLILTGPLKETDEPMADFAGRAADSYANYSFWRYSLGAYREILAMLGFAIDRVTRSRYRCLLNGGEEVEIPTLVASRRRQ